MEDPYSLRDRFVENQRLDFRSALVEIRQGQKRGHWLWFILPTAPYIVDGIEKGSRNNRFFALRGDDCVKAYLRFEYDGICLRDNYYAIVESIRMQLRGGNTLSYIFGPDNDVKVISSLTLFKRIATEINAVELAKACRSVLDMCA